MNRSQMYSLALNNYVQGNVKFLDKDGKSHDLGSAYTASDKFVFVEGEIPMPRHRLCNMLELEEGESLEHTKAPVMFVTHKRGKDIFHEIRSSYMDGNDLVLAEAEGMQRSQVKTFEQVLAELPDEQCLEDECWYKSSDIREFLVRLKAAHEAEAEQLLLEIAKLKDAQRWRKYPEEKPSEDTRYIICGSSGFRDADRWMYLKEKQQMGFGFHDYGVKYWMPMPAAPEEADECA